MNDEKKKIIEEVSKSEYFDFVLERELQKKLSESIKKYKWILSFVVGLFIFIASLIGLEIRNISLQRAEIEDNFTKYREIMARLTEDIERKQEEIQSLESFFGMFKEINDRYTDFYEEKFRGLNQTVVDGIVQIDTLTKENVNIRKETKENLQSMEKHILGSLHKFNNVLVDWESEKRELIKIASTVYAYIERGYDREPGTEEYRPEMVDLPFSDRTMRVTFNREESHIVKNRDSGYEELIKEAEVNITIYDKDNIKIFENPYVLKEKHPTNVPSTNHQIEAQFIYLPPNPPFQRIPDFVILAISLRESAYEKLLEKY